MDVSEHYKNMLRKMLQSAAGISPTEPDQLNKRWNLAASYAGFAGSEYVNEPEFTFARIMELKEEVHKARITNAKIRKSLLEFNKGGSAIDVVEDLIAILKEMKLDA